MIVLAVRRERLNNCVEGFYPLSPSRADARRAERHLRPPPFRFLVKRLERDAI
jgi:hypothetical protein